MEHGPTTASSRGSVPARRRSWVRSISAEPLHPGAQRRQLARRPRRRAAQPAELREQRVEHAEGLLEVGKAQEEVVLEGRTPILLCARVARSELGAAQALVDEQPAVERQLPAPLPARDHKPRAIEELAAAKPGADLGARVARAGDREPIPGGV